LYSLPPRCYKSQFKQLELQDNSHAIVLVVDKERMNTTVECVDQLLFDVTSQFAHALGGAFFVTAVAVVFGKCSTLYSALLFTTYAAIKEFAIDVAFEDTLNRGSGLEDFAFYELGVFIGILVNLFLPGTMDPRVLCFCAPRYKKLNGENDRQNYGLCLWRYSETS
jgi:hypothetical protein